MTQIPTWLKDRLQCPRTGVALQEETREGEQVFVAYPEAEDPLIYQIDNGVPVLLPQR